MALATRPDASEPHAHVTATHLQTALRLLLVTFVLATAVCLVFFKQVAYLAAIPIPIVYLVLVLTDYFERRTRSEVLGRAGRVARERADSELTVFSTALKIGGVLALAALIVSATLFDLELVGLMAAGIFLFMVFLGLPMWIAAIQETDVQRSKRSDPRDR